VVVGGWWWGMVGSGERQCAKKKKLCTHIPIFRYKQLHLLQNKYFGVSQKKFHAIIDTCFQFTLLMRGIIWITTDKL